MKIALTVAGSDSGGGAGIQADLKTFHQFGVFGTSAIVALTAQNTLGVRAVVDPVMVSTSGDRLLSPEAEAVVRERLVPLAELVTPNLDETEILTGLEVRDVEAMERAGARLVELGAGAALVKGGHLKTDTLTDVLVWRGGVRRFRRPRVRTTSTHGTGCTLSAAVTAGLALGRDLEGAVADALDYVARAIAAAPRLGQGHGPLHHGVAPRSEPSNGSM
jgi:hydroxymethylpyrimidine/phosphomethylpyrimidine kinase